MPHSHQCYFHKANKISHFCTLPQCTLPMCQECLAIHSQEHSRVQQNSKIIPFYVAEEKAIASLKSQINQLNVQRNQCKQSLQALQARLYKMIDEYIQQKKFEIEEMFKDLVEDEKRLAKIMKGSLKTLIYFYSDSKSKDHLICNSKFLASMNQSEGHFTKFMAEMSNKQLQQVKQVKDYQKTEVRREKSQKQIFQVREVTVGRNDSHACLQMQMQMNYEEKGLGLKDNPKRNRIHTQVEEVHKKVQFNKNSQNERSELKWDNKFENEKGRQNRQYSVGNHQLNIHSGNNRSDLANDHIKIEEDWNRQPLKPSDLNMDNGVKNTHKNYEQSSSHNKFSINGKEVLSPQEIRRMLEKRIEERSRIIAKTKALTPPKQEIPWERSVYQQSAIENDRNWDTKDSIINQIYSDLKY